MLLLFPLIVFVILILQDNVKGAENVFVQTGGDLVLNGTVLKKFGPFYWKFNSKATLVTFDSSGKPTVGKNYTGRIELFEDERSVKLKNLQKSDSGVYSAWSSGDKHELLETYNVTVKGSANHGVDAVLAVVLFPYLVGVAVFGAAAVITAVGLTVWCIIKKCRSSATSQGQTGPVHFSAGSGSTSPTIHMPLLPLFSNGAPHLISEEEVDLLTEENYADLPKAAEKTTDLA